MASTFDKKFKTTETTKAAGAEVVSDPIELSPRTKNHILTVTTDNSLSGTVDVEMEMSPDGTNWCPAVSRTVSGGAASSTGNVIGNEESVKLTPDAGEFKNKHARGGLNFDVNGAVVTPDGSGARDLMDQHIATTKSFNYSQWFKTSENPTTTYKPVLFRHGGYDNFSNAKTVQLTDTDPTSTDIANTQDSSGLLYLPSTITGFTGLNPDNSFTTVSWMDLNKFPASGTVYSGYNIVATSNTGIYMRDTNRSIGDRMYVYLQWRNGVAPFYGQAYFDITDYTKALCIIKRVDASAGVGNTGVAHIDVIDSDGTSLYNHQENYTIPSGYSISGNTWAAQSEWRERDEVAFLNTFVADGDLNTLYQTIGSNIKPKDFTNNANLLDWYRFGDNGTDTKALVTPFKGVFPTLTNSAFTSSDAIPALATTDNLYMSGPIKITQNLCIVEKNETAVKSPFNSYSGTSNTINVTVANNGTSNKFYADGVSSTGTLQLMEGATYIFDQSDSSNAGHPLRFSTTSDGSHGGGSEYTTGVTTAGTPGSSGAYTQIIVAASAPALYTYCTQHSGMGGAVNTAAVISRPGLKMSNASGSFINPFKLSTDSNPNTLPTISVADITVDSDRGIAISANIKVTGTGNGTNYNSARLWRIFFTDSNGNPKGTISTYFSRNNSNMYSMYQDENEGTLAYYGRPKSTMMNGDWNHISCNYYKKPSGTSHPQSYYSRMSINGDTPPVGGSSSSSNSFLDFDDLVVSKVELGGGTDYEHDIEFDNVCFYTGWLNTNTNWTSIYNARKNPLSFSSSNMVLKSCFTMGDGADDTANHLYKDIVEPSSGRQFIKHDSLSSISSVTLTSSDDPYNVAGGTLPEVFDTGVNSSISGWFKTTDTGVLFSNSSSGSDGLLFDIQASVYQLKFGSVSTIQSASSIIKDGEWHHLVITKAAKDGSNLTEVKVYIDGVLKSTTSVSSNLANSDLKGTNGFTLLSDGENNAIATSPASADSSKLNATLSNWSLHSEVLSANAVAQLYSNGHVRNIKNLPSVTSSAIKAWWQLADPTNPQNDLIGTNNLNYQGAVIPQNSKAIQGSDSGSAGRDFLLNGNRNPFANNDKMPLITSAFSISFWLYTPSSSSTTFDSIIAFSAANTTKHFKIFQLNNNLAFSFAGNNGASDYSIPWSGNDNTWKHIVMISGTGTTWASEVFVNGVRQTITQTFPGNGADRASNSWGDGTLATGDDMGEFFLCGSSRSYSTSNSFASSRVSRQYRIDQLATYSTALTHGTTNQGDTATGQVGSIYNSGSYVDLTTISGLGLEKYFKLGDHSSDVNSGTLKYYDEVNDTAYFEEEDNQSATTPGGTYSLATTDPSYSASMESLVSKLVTATGATYVNGSINGNAMTMSLTKSFNFTTKKWVSTADQDLALCLSFNGFEEQAEYFAIWKCAQTVGGKSIDICDGGWHNVILSYRGRNNLSGDNVDPGDTVKFGPGPANNLPYNWALSYDGEPLTVIKDGSGADYVGGLNTIVTDTYNATSYNVGFAIQDRHLKYQTANTEEEYKPHAQFSAGIHEVVGVDNNNAFQGYVDETSFHSDTWWVDQAGTSVSTLLNAEKPATIFGNTTALNNRQGASTEYPEGKPYPLLNPEKLTTSGLIADMTGTNQYINPNRYDASSNPNGGLEGWWRWGDTPGDCSITINDVRDHNASVNSRDIDAFGIVTADRQVMTSSDSIFLADSTASSGGGTTISFPQVKLEGIQSGICNLKNINSPLLQFVRVKIKGAGSMDLGEGKGLARLNYTNRRRRRKK